MKTSFLHGIWTQLSSLSIPADYQFIHRWYNFSHPHVNLLNSLWDIRLCDILGYDNTQSGRFTRFCKGHIATFIFSTVFLWNTDNHISYYSQSQPRRLQYQHPLLWKHHILYTQRFNSIITTAVLYRLKVEFNKQRAH